MEVSRTWAPYPELDTLTEARPISEQEALTVVEGLTRAELHAQCEDAAPPASG